jgi:hypothetical protein
MVVEKKCTHKRLLVGERVVGFEKLSLRRLGKPACPCAWDQQLIDKPLKRLL